MSGFPRLFAVLLPLALWACDDGGGGTVQERPPVRVSADQTYVFYLAPPGAEPSGAAELAERGYQVIASRLPADADLDFVAVAVKEHIRELLARGAAMDRIALVGRDQGAVLAMMVSGLAQVPASALVAVGGCPRGEAFDRMLRLHARTIKGRFLSLLRPGQAGDRSCLAVQRAANGAEGWEAEMAGDEAWIDETARWIDGG